MSTIFDCVYFCSKLKCLFHNIPGILKNLIDRQLPMSLPFMSTRQDGYGSGSHEARYDMEGKRHYLWLLFCKWKLWQCVANVDHFLGKGNYTTVFCGQGELFRVKELSARTSEYLTAVKCAGSEYARTGAISKETDEILHTLLYPKDVFEKNDGCQLGNQQNDRKEGTWWSCVYPTNGYSL